MTLNIFDIRSLTVFGFKSCVYQIVLETFDLLISIYSENSENLDLSFTFVSSGLAIIKKKN